MSNRNSTAPGAERRTSRRVPCGLLLDMRVGQALFRVEVMNISTTGMFVRPSGESPRSAFVMAARLKRGTRLFLRLDVSGGLELHEARGCVAWQSDLGMGIDFFEVSPAMRRLIGRIVDGNGHDPAILASIKAATLFQPA